MTTNWEISLMRDGMDGLRLVRWTGILFACHQLNCFPTVPLLAEALLEMGRVMNTGDPIYDCGNKEKERLISLITADLDALIQSHQVICDTADHYHLTERGQDNGIDALVPGSLANLAALCAFRRNLAFS